MQREIIRWGIDPCYGSGADRVEPELQVCERALSPSKSTPLAIMHCRVQMMATPDEFMILELALTGSKSGIAFRPQPSDDPAQRQPDITLARKVLQWAPASRLDDGLRKAIDYFRGAAAPR